LAENFSYLSWRLDDPFSFSGRSFTPLIPGSDDVTSGQKIYLARSLARSPIGFLLAPALTDGGKK